MWHFSWGWHLWKSVWVAGATWISLAFSSIQMSSFPDSLYHKRGSWDCTWALGPQQEEAGRYSPQAHPAGETPVVPRAGHHWDPRSFSGLQGWSSSSVPAICNSEVYDPGVISSGSRGLKSKSISYAMENSFFFFFLPKRVISSRFLCGLFPLLLLSLIICPFATEVVLLKFSHLLFEWMWH